MRVLLTGGTGFIGRSLIRRFLSKGVALGLLLRRDMRVNQGVQSYVLGTKRWSKEKICNAMRAFKPDVIVHLAGVLRTSLLDQLYEANVFLGERMMAASADTAPAARIILAGSAAEYGSPTRPDGLVHENDSCLPMTPYGITKLAQTLHGQARARGGQSITIARLFNPVGIHMPLGLAFADFADKIAAGKDTLCVGNIDVNRDFMSVGEAARILCELTENPGANGWVVNVCSGIAQPLRNGLERLIAHVGRPIEIVRDPLLIRGADVATICGGTARLNALGIRPAAADIGLELDAMMDARLREFRN